MNKMLNRLLISNLFYKVEQLDVTTLPTIYVNFDLVDNEVVI